MSFDLVTVTRRFTFEMAHRLPLHTGKCKNLHGHSYKLEVSLGAKPQSTLRVDELEVLEVENSLRTKEDAKGMVADFGEVKQVLGNYIDARLDHNVMLHEKDPLVGLLLNSGTKIGDKAPMIVGWQPTVENIAKFLFRQFVDLIAIHETLGELVVVKQVRVEETENCWAVYNGR